MKSRPWAKNRKTLGLGLAALGYATLMSFAGCGEDPYDGQSWSETAIAVIGGTVLATEGTMHLVEQIYVPKPTLFDVMKDVFSPLPVAHAINTCAVVGGVSSSQFSCDGNMLKVFYNNCAFPDRTAQHPGYWRTYSKFLNVDPLSCDALIQGTKTFQEIEFPSITRQFGLGTDEQGGDENNFRISPKGTLVYMHTTYPSGWYDSSVKGGMEISFSAVEGVPERRISIKGIHLIEYSLDEALFQQIVGTTLPGLENGESFNLDSVSMDTEGGQVSVTFDNTLDTQHLLTRGSGEEEEDYWEIQGSTTYDPIIVLGTGANRTLASFKVRIQHNVSHTIVVSKSLPGELVARFAANGDTLDTNAVSWANDANCCWPTQGEILTNFYNTDEMTRDYRSTLTQFTPTCGEVRIRYYSDTNARGPVNGGAAQPHLLSHCF